MLALALNEARAGMTIGGLGLDARKMIQPEDVAELGWCGQPEATVQCMDDGQVRLTGVELDAYQPILLPRKWDDPEREPDENPEEELAAFAQRVRDAMTEWGEAVKVLRIVNVSRETGDA